MRRLALVIALLAPATAHAEWIAWTPVRLALGVAVDVPRSSDYVLTDVRLDIAQQVGGAHVDGNAHTGSGPFASLAGIGSLGLYSPIGGADGCKDQVDPGDPSTPDDDTRRWTCGRLSLGAAATLGWAWGSLLRSGYMLPEHSVYLQFAPYGAAAKRPDIDRTFELDFTASAGYWWSWAGVSARWSRVPGDDYYGVGFQLTRGFSEWFANDEKVDPEPVEVASDTPPALRIELGGGGMSAVHRAHDSAAGFGLLHLGVYKRSSIEPYGPFAGIGGAVTLGSTDADAFTIGPAATIGQRGRHVGVYVRARPLIGARSFGDDTRFDYGVDGAVGISLTSPHLELDDTSDGHVDEDNGMSLGLEFTAAWRDGDVYIGGNGQLLAF